jgi:hypothetical protein
MYILYWLYAVQRLWFIRPECSHNYSYYACCILCHLCTGHVDYSVNGMARRSQSLRLGRSDGDVGGGGGGGVILGKNNNSSCSSRAAQETRLIMEPGEEHYK